jgi:hypothetical protein
MKLYVINIMKYIILIIVVLYFINRTMSIDDFTDNKGFSEKYRSVFETHKLNFF